MATHLRAKLEFSLRFDIISKLHNHFLNLFNNLDTFETNAMDAERYQVI